MDPATFTSIAAVALVGALIVLSILAFVWPNEPLDDDDRDIDTTPLAVLDRHHDDKESQ